MMLVVVAAGFGAADAPSSGGTVFSVGSSSLLHAASANVAIASVNAEILRPEKSIGHPGVLSHRVCRGSARPHSRQPALSNCGRMVAMSHARHGDVTAEVGTTATTAARR